MNTQTVVTLPDRVGAVCFVSMPGEFEARLWLPRGADGVLRRVKSVHDSWNFYYGCRM